MLVTTGNKSEVSVGYATLYGDMNGGFNPIKDLYKTEVYRLARYRNGERPPGCRGPEGEVIPASIIDKAPTAELRRTRRTRIRCRPTTCSTPSSRAWSRRRCGVQRDRRARPRPRDGEAGRAPALPRRIQAPPGRAGRQDHAAEFRPRPPLPDHQPLPRRGLTGGHGGPANLPQA